MTASGETRDARGRIEAVFRQDGACVGGAGFSILWLMGAF